MHIYLVYLVLNESLKHQYPYLINPDMIQYNTDNVSVSLYGFTNDEDTFINFSDVRNKDIFYYKRKKVKKKEYMEFKLKYILYEMNMVRLSGSFDKFALTKFEEMVSTDINLYAPSIDEVVEINRVNVDENSIEYLKYNELKEMIDDIYGKFRDHFDIWLRYFAPTIDIKQLYLKTKGH